MSNSSWSNQTVVRKEQDIWHKNVLAKFSHTCQKKQGEAVTQIWSLAKHGMGAGVTWAKEKHQL
jgi:hypothetical protein